MIKNVISTGLNQSEIIKGLFVLITTDKTRLAVKASYTDSLSISAGQIQSFLLSVGFIF